MSNLADPASTAEFVYESISGHARVTVRARFLTEREVIRHDELYKSAIGSGLTTRDPKFLSLRDEMIGIGIVSPSIDELKSVFTPSDLWQLATRYPDQVGDIEIMLGKSRSRRQFIQATSAVDAVAPSAITNQAAPANPQTNTLPSS